MTNSPNIVFIICDDLAYGDLSCHGNPYCQTPAIDSLKDAGASFGHYHSGPLCTPARSAILTGRYPYRTRAFDTYLGRSMIDPDETTIAQLLQESGHATGLFGKWHLGDCYPMRPQDLGFEEVLMHGGGGLRQPANPNEGSYFNPELFQNGKLTRREGYCSDIFADETIDFIKRNRSKPFFAYLGFNAPHTPLEVHSSYLSKYTQQGLPDRLARLYGMVENIDQNVGRILDTLEELKLTESTIVVFTSDHGPCGSTQDENGNIRYNAGLRGIKGTLYEGGIRVPCLVRWPREIRPGTQIERLANSIDWLATLTDATGAKAPTDRTIDGISLLPLLKDSEAETPDRALCMQWHRGDNPVRFRNFAAFTEQYKLTRPHEDAPDELYDLIADPQETSNLANQLPEIVDTLRARYEDWFADVSSTREDNYAPPRIVVGHCKGDPTLLTWQDWRLYGETDSWSYDNPGYWEITFHQKAPYELTIEIPNSHVGGELIIRCRDWECKTPLTQALLDGSFGQFASLAFTTPELDQGPARFEAFVEFDGDRLGITRAYIRAATLQLS
ncbi:MAG: arylsulfatase [Verrucomicrobiota bacterium]